MIVEQIWTGNDYRNFNYLIVSPETGEALAVDPLDFEKCLGRAREKGWEITQILQLRLYGITLCGFGNTTGVIAIDVGTRQHNA